MMNEQSQRTFSMEIGRRYDIFTKRYQILNLEIGHFCFFTNSF